MKKNFRWMLSLLVALFAVSVIGNTAFAAGNYNNIADGNYELGVTALKDGTDEVSLANDFVRGATLTIDNGSPALTLGIGAGDGDFSEFDFSIEWVTVEGNEPSSASEEGDLTYYTFQLNELDNNLSAAMEYVVPDFPPLKDGHEVAFDLQLGGLDDLPVNGAEEPEGDNDNADNNGDNNGTVEDNGDNDDNGNGTTEDNGNNEDNDSGAVEDNGDNGNGTTDGEQVTNPQTGDSSNIWLYTLLLIGSIIPLAIKIKRRFA